MPVETKKSKGKDDEQWTASYLTAACKSVQDTRLFHNNHQSFCIQISIDVSNHKWQQKHQRALYSQGFWQATCDRLTREWSPLLSVAHWRTHSSTIATRTLAMWNEAIDPSSEFQPGFMMGFYAFQSRRTDWRVHCESVQIQLGKPGSLCLMVVLKQPNSTTMLHPIYWTCHFFVGWIFQPEKVGVSTMEGTIVLKDLDFSCASPGTVETYGNISKLFQWRIIRSISCCKGNGWI